MGVTRQVDVTATPVHDWILNYKGIYRQLWTFRKTVAQDVQQYQRINYSKFSTNIKSLPALSYCV